MRRCRCTRSAARRTRYHRRCKFRRRTDLARTPTTWRSLCACASHLRRGTSHSGSVALGTRSPADTALTPRPACLRAAAHPMGTCNNAFTRVPACSCVCKRGIPSVAGVHEEGMREIWGTGGRGDVYVVDPRANRSSSRRWRRAGACARVVVSLLRAYPCLRGRGHVLGIDSRDDDHHRRDNDCDDCDGYEGGGTDDDDVGGGTDDDGAR